MTVPVLWVSRHQGVLARGYYDQALLEAVLDRSLWRPPGALEYEHRVLGPTRDEPEREPVLNFGAHAPDGGVVVFASRHHAGEEKEIADNLARMAWAVVLMTSEEEWLFDWRRLVGDVDLDPDRYRFWAWQPLPEHADLSWRMPCGPYPGARQALAELTAEDTADRPLDWFYGGQVTHERGQALARALTALELSTRGESILTSRYLESPLPYGEYLHHMARAKAVPCRSGPVSVCTARVEEALEAGCVPLVDLLRPGDRPQFDYWRTLFGDDCPLTGVRDWEAELPGLLAHVQADWPALPNRLTAWWVHWKRATAHRLDDDVRSVRSGAGLPGGREPRTEASGPSPAPDTLDVSPGRPDDLLTVLVPTSPTPGHPSTLDLEETLSSVREQLPDAEVVLVADGVRPEQEHLRGPYEEYLRRVCWKSQHEWRNVLPVVLDEWGHQANAVRRALGEVTTPLVLFVEHDTPLVRGADWPGVELYDWAALCAFVLSGEANLVRFHFDVTIHRDHEAGMLDHQTHRVGPGVPARRTSTWWQRPHLASAHFYRGVLERFRPESRTMVEDVMHGVVSTDHLVRGDAAWWDWRLWVYTPESSSPLGIKRSTHLDSRGSESKYEETMHN